MKTKTLIVPEISSNQDIVLNVLHIYDWTFKYISCDMSIAIFQLVNLVIYYYSSFLLAWFLTQNEINLQSKLDEIS